jgi:hypothetical protein
MDVVRIGDRFEERAGEIAQQEPHPIVQAVLVALHDAAEVGRIILRAPGSVKPRNHCARAPAVLACQPDVACRDPRSVRARGLVRGSVTADMRR